MTINARLRFEILRRDDHTCRYCGAGAPDVKLTVDHVVPRSLGGSDEPTNLVTACLDCNLGKGSSCPDEQIVADIDERAQAHKQAQDERLASDSLEHEQLNRIDEKWCHWQHDGDIVPRPTWWRRPVRSYLQDLVVEDILEMIEVTMNAGHVAIDRRWPYFLGCCRRRRDERLGTTHPEPADEWVRFAHPACLNSGDIDHYSSTWVIAEDHRLVVWNRLSELDQSEQTIARSECEVRTEAEVVDAGAVLVGTLAVSAGAVDELVALYGRRPVSDAADELYAVGLSQLDGDEWVSAMERQLRAVTC